MGLFYEEIFGALNNAHIRYLVAGGVALNLHGVPRATMDLDLAIQLVTENIQKTTDVLTQLGYEPRVSVDPSDLANAEKRQYWKMEKNMNVFSFARKEYSYQVIDLFIDLPISFEEMDYDKTIIEYRHLSVPIVSRRHLKEMKEVAGRAQDLSDIRSLEVLEKEEKKDAKE